MHSEEWLSTGQAGRLVGVSSQWIRRLAKDGQLDYVETALGFLVRRSGVEELARRRSEKLTNRAAGVAA